MKTLKQKKLFLMLCIMAVTHTFAQKDSTGFKFSGFQGDIGAGLHTTPAVADQQKLQTFVPGDAFLHRDLTAYKQENYYSTNGVFSGMIGGRVFFKQKKSKLNPEFFIGLRYGNDLVAYSTYLKTTYDTLYGYTDPASGQTNYILRKQADEYSFSIWGRRLFVPLGMNITTRQDKFFWYSAGVELTPFISFDHRFVSIRTLASNDMLVEAGEDPDQMPTGNSYSATHSQEEQKVKGSGGGMYLGIPLAIYFHPFRRENSFLKDLHFLGALMPLLIVSDTKFSDPVNQGLLQVNAGVRVNLSK